MKNTKLKEIIEEMLNGKVLRFDGRINQYGEIVGESYLTINRKWVATLEWQEILCISSSWLGLGNCQCNSHDFLDEGTKYLKGKKEIISFIQEIVDKRDYELT